MKVAIIGTYPPRECGIGTFTRNLFTAMQCNAEQQMNDYEAFIVAMNDFPEGYAYPEEVKNPSFNEKEVLFDANVSSGQLYEIKYRPELRNSALLLYRLILDDKVTAGKLIFQK